MAKSKGYPEALEKKLHDQRFYREDTTPDFTKRVEGISRTIAHMCYQCGTCTGSCPSAPRSTYRIRKFMRRAVLGLENESLNDPDLWLCTTCYSCTDRCPRDIAPTDVIMAMRNIAFTHDVVPVNFLKTVQAIYSSGHGVPNNDVNRAAREKLGLTRDPPTTHMYPNIYPASGRSLTTTISRQMPTGLSRNGRDKRACQNQQQTTRSHSTLAVLRRTGIPAVRRRPSKAARNLASILSPSREQAAARPRCIRFH